MKNYFCLCSSDHVSKWEIFVQLRLQVLTSISLSFGPWVMVLLEECHREKSPLRLWLIPTRVVRVVSACCKLHLQIITIMSTSVSVSICEILFACPHAAQFGVRPPPWAWALIIYGPALRHPMIVMQRSWSQRWSPLALRSCEWKWKVEL